MTERKNSIIVRSVGAAMLLIGFSYGHAEAAYYYTSELKPLNNSGVRGSAELTLDDDLNTLSVTIRASGLEPRRVHPITIEGDFNSWGNALESPTPERSQDTDGDGYLELGEVQKEAGTVLLALSTPPDGGLGDFPSTADGNLTYSATYNLNDDSIFPDEFDSSDLSPLFRRQLVIYGDNVNGSGEGTDGEVNGTEGYKVHLPVAFGDIEKATGPFSNNVDHQVPEPSALALIGAALGALVFAGRSR